MKIKNGFTLIELLVVMVIIGLLAGLILPNFMSARERARDAQRKSDLEQIQKALELYKMDKNEYPATSDPFAPPGSSGCNKEWKVGTTTYMPKLPCDPKSTGEYKYKYTRGTDKFTYTLDACLENRSDPDAVTIDRCPDPGDVGIMRTEP